MLIVRYLVAILTLALTPFVASAWEGVVDHRMIEPPRGEIYPYNSDSLLRSGDVYSSLYVSRVDSWKRSVQCDTLFESKYVFPFDWLNRQVILRVGSVDAPYTLEINGREVAYVSNGTARTEFNVTRETEEGLNFVALRLSPNAASRRVDGWRSDDGKIGDNPIRDVEVIAPATMSIRDVFTATDNSGGVMNTLFGVAIKSYNLNERHSLLRYKLRNQDGDLVANGTESMQLRYRGEDTIYLTTRLPRGSAWSGGKPVMHTLDIELINDFRVVERHRLAVGLRELKVDSDGEVSINGEAVTLRAKEVMGDISRSEIIDLRNEGINTLIFKAGYEPTKALKICDELGLYAVITAPIDSSRSGGDIKAGGNVTNSVEWRGEYISRLERSYYNLRLHPSVIAYNMASRSLNGYNLYEGYLYLKSLQSTLPIVNLDGGGEWNGDKLNMKLIKY